MQRAGEPVAVTDAALIQGPAGAAVAWHNMYDSHTDYIDIDVGQYEISSLQHWNINVPIHQIAAVNSWPSLDLGDIYPTCSVQEATVAADKFNINQLGAPTAHLPYDAIVNSKGT